jgi:hypothetical protein
MAVSSAAPSVVGVPVQGTVTVNAPAEPTTTASPTNVLLAAKTAAVATVPDRRPMTLTFRSAPGRLKAGLVSREHNRPQPRHRSSCFPQLPAAGAT